MRYDIFKSESSGKFHFNLKAKNGQIILASQAYEGLDGAKNGIASVKKNCGNRKNFEIKPAANGKHYFVLNAGNNQVIGKSQMYASTDGANKGIDSVQENGPASEVVILG